MVYSTTKVVGAMDYSRYLVTKVPIASSEITAFMERTDQLLRERPWGEDGVSLGDLKRYCLLWIELADAIHRAGRVSTTLGQWHFIDRHSGCASDQYWFEPTTKSAAYAWRYLCNQGRQNMLAYEKYGWLQGKWHSAKMELAVDPYSRTNRCIPLAGTQLMSDLRSVMGMLAFVRKTIFVQRWTTRSAGTRSQPALRLEEMIRVLFMATRARGLLLAGAARSVVAGDPKLTTVAGATHEATATMNLFWEADSIITLLLRCKEPVIRKGSNPYPSRRDAAADQNPQLADTLRRWRVHAQNRAIQEHSRQLFGSGRCALAHAVAAAWRTITRFPPNMCDADTWSALEEHGGKPSADVFGGFECDDPNAYGSDDDDEDDVDAIARVGKMTSLVELVQCIPPPEALSPFFVHGRSPLPVDSPRFSVIPL